MRPTFGLRFFLMSLLLLAGCSRNGEFPSRPITLLCPWSAGGGTDRVSRQVAKQLEALLGAPVNVVNATGGAGVTGHTRGVLARPDGYTLAMITPELAMLHWRGLTNITYHDFDPIILLNRDNAALFVRDEAPWRTLAELEADIRRRPGEIKGAGTAFGGVWHIGVAGWMTRIGMQPNDVLWVSLNGSAPSLQELMAGGVDLVCCSVPEAQALLDGGRLRCLGIMAEKRMASEPDIPTFQELGVDWSLGGWRGVALPLGTPPERRDILQRALTQVVRSEEYQKFLSQANFGYAIEADARFLRTLEASDKEYGEILTSPAFQDVQRQRIGPMAFPTILAGLLVLGVIGSAMTARPTNNTDQYRFNRAGLLRIGVFLGGIVLFIVFADTTGYVLAGLALLLAFLAVLRVRMLTAIPLALLVVLATYQIFAVYLRVPLPWGWLGW